MIYRVLLEAVKTPGGGGELKLYQHDKDFYILSENKELMSSRMHESEEALARLAVEKIAKRENPRVLICGLGMGYSLRAALDGLPPTAKVVISELVPAVIKWNQGLLAHLADNPLADKRVELREGDAAKIIKKGKGNYDAILMDVDNGPSGLSRKSNGWFYGVAGLYAARNALSPKGVLAIWSAAADIQFSRRLEDVGFYVESIRVRSRPGKKGSHHHIWMAVKKYKSESASKNKTKESKLPERSIVSKRKKY